MGKLLIFTGSLRSAGILLGMAALGGHAAAAAPPVDTGALPVNPAQVAQQLNPAEPPLPQPDEGDTFRPFLSDQESYDSNLYRIPSGAAALAALVGLGHSGADHINVASAGADAQWVLARQSFLLDLRADENRFARNAGLNNTAADGRAVWDWRLGEEFSGVVGYEYKRALAAFANTRFFALDMTENNQSFANLRWQLGPRWAIYGNAAETHTSNSAAAQRVNDAEIGTGNLGIEYATSPADSFSVEFDRTTGRFPSDVLVGDVLFDRNFTEKSGRLLVHYGISEKTLLTASAGYLKRDYPTDPFGSFSGDIWRVSVQWFTTEKLQFAFAGFHELQAYLDSQSNYFVNKGGSISPAWTISDKLSVTGTVTISNQDYIGSSLDVLSIGAREDHLDSEELDIVYTPNRPLSFKAGYRYERRSSNLQAFNYDDRIVAASITFTF
jgi:exopolysaccharide biosynthesis operon protein EpsL